MRFWLALAFRIVSFLQKMETRNAWSLTTSLLHQLGDQPGTNSTT